MQICGEDGSSIRAGTAVTRSVRVWDGGDVSVNELELRGRPLTNLLLAVEQEKAFILCCLCSSSVPTYGIRRVGVSP